MSTMGTGFPAFDDATGGLPSGRDYLVYGAIGTGKTSFGLGFLFAGLEAGESAALVTRRAPKPVLEQGRALGWDLEPHVRSGRLTVLEYPQDLHEQAPLLRDGSAVYEGFRAMLAGNSIRRLVFDPVTPLLMLPGAAPQTQRVRPLMQAFAELQATTLYIVDTPEGEAYLPGCKDQVYGMLRFEAGRRGRRLAIERIPGTAPRVARLVFDVRPGGGMVECTEAEAEAPEFGERLAPEHAAVFDAEAVTPAVRPAWNARLVAGRSGARRVRRHGGRWLVLVAGPDAARRSALRAAVEPDASVVEAHGPAECLRVMAAEQPDLVLLAQESRGITALELIRRLRSGGAAVPVVLVGERLRRMSDRVRSLEAGADLTLEWPLDLRLVRLHLRHLLNRSATALAGHAMAAAFEVAPPPRREPLTCTASAGEFRERMRAEAGYALSANLPFAVVAIHSPGGADTAEDLASVMSFVSRQDDLTYSGECGAAVILPEAADAEPFLKRFQARWHAGHRPVIDCRYFDGTENFADETVDSLVLLLGSREGAEEGEPLLSGLNGQLQASVASVERVKAHEKANGALPNGKPFAAAAAAGSDADHGEAPRSPLQ